MCYMDSKEDKTIIKEKKKPCLDGGNNTTVMETFSKSTMKAAKSDDTIQTKEDDGRR